METTSPVMSITDEQIAEIEGLANKATKGQWCTDGADWVCSADSDQLNNGFVLGICEGPDALSNASYMAAASAESVLALISRLRAAEAEADEYFAKYQAERARAESYLEMPRALLRSDQLLNECRQQLRAAERDAARYRFIKNACEVSYLGADIEDDGHIDKIMAAMKGEQQ